MALDRMPAGASQIILWLRRMPQENDDAATRAALAAVQNVRADPRLRDRACATLWRAARGMILATYTHLRVDRGGYMSEHWCATFLVEAMDELLVTTRATSIPEYIRYVQRCLFGLRVTLKNRPTELVNPNRRDPGNAPDPAAVHAVLVVLERTIDDKIPSPAIRAALQQHLGLGEAASARRAGKPGPPEERDVRALCAANGISRQAFYENLAIVRGAIQHHLDDHPLSWT